MMQNAMQLAQQMICRGEQVWVSSRKVAADFGKLHKNVLRQIEQQLRDMPEDFARLNFELSEYVDSTGRTLPEIMMTKNGFIFTVMSFTGADAAQIKVAYIMAFDAMRELISGGSETLRELREHNEYMRQLLTIQASYNGRGLHQRRMQLEAERRWFAKDQMRLPFQEEVRRTIAAASEGEGP